MVSRMTDTAMTMIAAWMTLRSSTVWVRILRSRRSSTPSEAYLPSRRSSTIRTTLRASQASAPTIPTISRKFTPANQG